MHAKTAPQMVAMATLCLAAPLAHAFSFDFENGDLGPWLSSVSGSGTTNVTLHNTSLMAHEQQVTGGTRTLSFDFDYVPTDTLAFDMHAMSAGYQSGAGVRINFNNAFNVALGSVAFYNLTDAAQLPVHGFAIDAVQHRYSASESSFAAQAGLLAAAPISKVSIIFAAWNSGLASTNGEVWFDNVTNAVPEPNTLITMLVGVMALVPLTLRKQTR
jgi:hypothetical protein